VRWAGDAALVAHRLSLERLGFLSTIVDVERGQDRVVVRLPVAPAAPRPTATPSPTAKAQGDPYKPSPY
jgi:hypothetical protein